MVQPAIAPERDALIERQRGFFDLQLLFAERLAHLWGKPLGSVAAQWTNLHRRLALGTPDPAQPRIEWIAFADGLEQQTSHAGRLEYALEALKTCPEPPPPAGQTAFGCFAVEPPNERGEVHIHFHNRDSDAEGGPLCKAKIHRRLEELRALVQHASLDPQAQAVLGGSWLYSIDAYRRLFPAPYIASLRLEPQINQMRGLSMWGQFLTHRGVYRQELGNTLLVRLGRLDPARPDLIFPFRKLLALAPLTTFQEHVVNALPDWP